MKTLPISAKRARKTRGFTLIEMLVALLLLSIGLLGVAALQTRGQQMNHAAYIRTQANLLAYEIIDKIRANADVARDIGNQGYILTAAPSKPGTLCDATPCNAQQLRQYDLWLWYDRVTKTLPEGSALISAEVVGATRIEYTISITWGLRASEQDSDEETTRTQTWGMRL